MSELNALSAALNKYRDRIDAALAITPPTDDVPDYQTGYRDALAAVTRALTTNGATA